MSHMASSTRDSNPGLNTPTHPHLPSSGPTHDHDTPFDDSGAREYCEFLQAISDQGNRFGLEDMAPSPFPGISQYIPPSPETWADEYRFSNPILNNATFTYPGPSDLSQTSFNDQIPSGPFGEAAAESTNFDDPIQDAYPPDAYIIASAALPAHSSRRTFVQHSQISAPIQEHDEPEVPRPSVHLIPPPEPIPALASMTTPASPSAVDPAPPSSPAPNLVIIETQKTDPVIPSRHPIPQYSLILQGARAGPVTGADYVHFFVERDGRRESGIRVRDALNHLYAGLVGRDSEPSLGACGSSISFHIKWMGYPAHKRQIKTHDWTRHRKPVKMWKLANSVANFVNSVIEELKHETIEPGWERWKVGPEHLNSDNIYIAGVRPATKAGWQVDLTCDFPVGNPLALG